MLCFLSEAGCKCRKKLVSITTIRFRRSSGAGCRKTLFQTCELRIVSPSDMSENLREGMPKGTSYALIVAVLKPERSTTDRPIDRALPETSCSYRFPTDRRRRCESHNVPT